MCCWISRPEMKSGLTGPADSRSREIPDLFPVGKTHRSLPPLICACRVDVRDWMPASLTEAMLEEGVDNTPGHDFLFRIILPLNDSMFTASFPRDLEKMLSFPPVRFSQPQGSP